jgi:hypothetical protein
MRDTVDELRRTRKVAKQGASDFADSFRLTCPSPAQQLLNIYVVPMSKLDWRMPI